MTVADLITKIQKIDYIEKEKKQKLLEHIPQMNLPQLNHLAGLLLWSEEQISQIDAEQKIVLNGLMATFTTMNRNAKKVAKKTVLITAEKEQDTQDQVTSETLLTQLDEIQ